MLKIIIFFMMSCFLVAKGRLHNERWYQDKIADLWNAKKEVVIINGRIDIVGEKYSTEVEFADNWKESIGQALWYAMNTNKKAGIVLICEKKSDLLHVMRLRSVLLNANLSIKVWTVWAENETIRIEN